MGSPPVRTPWRSTPAQCSTAPRTPCWLRREAKVGSGMRMSRARRSTRRYSVAESALKSACLRRCASLAVMAASKSTFWSSCLGPACLPKACWGDSASRTRGRRLLGSALPSALGSNCDSSLCAMLGLRKKASNSSRNTMRSCSRLTSTASRAALRSSLSARPTASAAWVDKAMRALSTRTPARRRLRPKAARLSASLPVRESPSCMAAVGAGEGVK